MCLDSPGCITYAVTDNKCGYQTKKDITVLITFIKFENEAPLYEREIKRNS